MNPHCISRQSQSHQIKYLILKDNKLMQEKSICSTHNMQITTNELYKFIYANKQTFSTDCSPQSGCRLEQWNTAQFLKTLPYSMTK